MALFDNLDPQQAGMLQAAFTMLQGSGPSRTPTGFGQILGQAGQAGLQAADASKKQAMAQALQDVETKVKKAQLDKTVYELDLQKQLMSPDGILAKGMADPELMEAVGTRMALNGHPGGAALVTAAEKIRTKRAAEQQFQTLKSNVETIQPDPQEARQSADYGTPEVPPAQVRRGGIFGALSESPYVGTEAKGMQGILDASKGGDPEAWVKHYERLFAAHKTAQEKDTAETNRLLNLPKSEHVIQDRTSPTGWSYEDTRTNVRTKGAPPPSSANNTPLGEVVPPQHKDLHGMDYLSTLPGGMAEVVKSIAEGRVDPSKAASMRYGNRDAIMQRVLQYDPKYNQQRVAVYKDFTSGKTNTNITAMNTVIAHMGTVSELAEAQKNGNVQAVNAILNRMRTETGNPSINNTEIAVQAMSNELMRVFRQVNASQHEVEAWEKKFNAAKASPEQLQGALKVGAELLKGRIDAVNDQWKRGMDSESDFPNILSPKSAAAMQKLGIGGKAASAAGPFSDPEKERKYQEWKARQGR